MMLDQAILQSAIKDVLEHMPYRPFLCLPMSATLYAVLKDNHNVNARIATGNLSYKGEQIFKQDFSITKAQDNIFQEWSGHAWVEFDGLICDLSVFRTVYSDKFTKPCKADFIRFFGEGRGCLIASPSIMQTFGLTYQPVEYLSDEMATGIIRGMERLLGE